MKRLTLLFILFFIAQNTSAQFYLTAGVSRNKEGGGYYDPKIYQDVFSSSINDRYKYDFYEIGALYKNKDIVVAADVGLTHKNLHMSKREGCPRYYNHGMFSEATYHHKSFDVQFAYLGTKCTVGRAFFHKNKFNLFLGGFLNMEFLLTEKESNHYDSIVERYTGYWYNQTTMEEEYYANESYEISKEEYNGFGTRGILASVGLTLSPSYTVNRFRIAASISYGLNFYPRTTFDNHSCWNVEDEQKLFFPQFGISVGYRLEKKS